MTSELKPCPFCGGEAEFQIFDNACNVVCRECHIGTRYESLDCHERVIEAWNTRHVETCEAVEYKRGCCTFWKCSECNANVEFARYCPSCGRKVVDNADK